MSSIADSLRSAAPRLSPRRLAAVGAAWLALVAGGLLVAFSLDSPVGAGTRDEAQPAPAAQVDAADPSVGVLPPFAMVLDRPMPKGVAGLQPARQAVELRVRAMRTRDPERFVELGSVLQVLGDTTSARFSYQSALRFGPGDLGAQVGLAMVDGGEGAAGLALAAARLQALAAAHPGDQLISFNRAWTDIYRRRETAAKEALARTAALDPDSRLGRTATGLVKVLDQIEVRPAP